MGNRVTRILVVALTAALLIAGSPAASLTSAVQASALPSSMPIGSSVTWDVTTTGLTPGTALEVHRRVGTDGTWHRIRSGAVGNDGTASFDLAPNRIDTFFFKVLVLTSPVQTTPVQSIRVTRTAQPDPSPPVPPQGTVRFSAAGDYGATVATRATLGLVQQRGGAFHLALGDMSYDDVTPERAWCDLVKARVGGTYPFELLSGNHESDGRDGLIDRFAACLPNRLPGMVGDYGKQYYVDVPATNPVARIIMISPGLSFGGSVWAYKQDRVRYRWTERAIDTAARAGIDWVVVGMHKPCLSMGRYDCPAGADIMNLLVRKRVDLVLTGHEHLYQRSKQIRTGPGCRRVPAAGFDRDCVASASRTVRAGKGTVFITAGTGGTALRAVNLRDRQRGFFASWSGANANPRHGIVTVDISDAALTARFVGSTGGSFTDVATIVR